MISPTGKEIRGSDKWGSGSFGAPRGGRTHQGADFVCRPGQVVLAPATGYVIREARPYAGWDYSGLLIQAGKLAIKLFYMRPYPHLIHTGVEQGQAIGIAQDVSHPRYPGMTPHIHMEIQAPDGRHVDPALLTGSPCLVVRQKGEIK